MATTDRRDDVPSPNAERLREAMGWDNLPEMTADQRATFDENDQRAEEFVMPAAAVAEANNTLGADHNA
jgi:hypothetical protein